LGYDFEKGPHLDAIQPLAAISMIAILAAIFFPVFAQAKTPALVASGCHRGAGTDQFVGPMGTPAHASPPPIEELGGPSTVQRNAHEPSGR